MAENVSESPLKDVVLCGTSLDQDARNRLASIVLEMGATHTLDLTSDVTHLLVGNIDSEKYKHVARHRPDISVLRPEWLAAVQEVWKSGDELDIHDLEAQYRLPTFFDLDICLSGFTDTRQRQELQSSIEEHGARYHGDLTKNVSHLVVANPSGAKYDRAKVWKIKTVSLRWYEKCLDRGMVLDETAFNPLLRPEEQGLNVFIPRNRKVKGDKRAAPQDQDSIDSNQRRKIRRTASTRLNSQSQNLWEDIKPLSAVNSPVPDDSWTQSVDARPTIETQTIPRPVGAATVSESRQIGPSRGQGVFARFRCLTYGHTGERDAKLRMVLSENGAEIVDTASDLPDEESTWTALILPSEWTAKVQPPSKVPKHPPNTWIVTEWWVERCLLKKKVLNPASDIFSRPHIQLPADCFKGHVISSSGLGSEIRYIAKMVAAAGGSYEERVSRKTTILVYDEANADLEKPIYCVQRGIDVVTPQWFHVSLEKQTAMPAMRYHLADSTCTAIRQVIQSRQRTASGADVRDEQRESSRPSSRAVEEHTRLVKKHTGQRLTGTRRAMTPSLPLTKSLPTVTTVYTQPLAKVQPLEQLQPNSQERPKSLPSTGAEGKSDKSRSPKRRITPDEKENDLPLPDYDDTHSVIAPAVPAPQSRPVSEHASELLTSLLARRQTSSSTHSEDKPDTAKRKRTLGRAASGSNTNSSNRPAQNLFLEDEDSASNPYEAPLPSQQITYDAPGAQEQRKYMEKKMGTAFDEEVGRRVQHVGVLKDADSGGRANVAGRLTRGRHRDTGTPDF